MLIKGSKKPVYARSTKFVDNQSTTNSSLGKNDPKSKPSIIIFIPPLIIF
jgi:hypothetical protein